MRRLAVYSLMHFLVDFSCALLMLGRLCPAGDSVRLLLLYNFCAFALQMPLGLIADRRNQNSAFAAAGCFCCGLAWGSAGLAGAILAGVGNALFHIGGGVDVLNRSEKNCKALGIFVSPGALGIFLGALAGVQQRIAPAFLIGALGLGGGLILFLCRPSCNAVLSLPPADLGRRKTSAALGVLFLVVILRSYVGMLFAFPWKKGMFWGAALALAVVLGKTAGGILGDRFGKIPTAGVSLSLAALLFLASDQPVLGLTAVFAFNMTMPLTLWAAARLMPGAKGFAFGLLTFALFLGFLPVHLGWSEPLPLRLAYALGALISLPLLRAGLKQAERAGGEEGIRQDA